MLYLRSSKSCSTAQARHQGVQIPHNPVRFLTLSRDAQTMPQPLYSTTIYGVLSGQPATVGEITRGPNTYASSGHILELRAERTKAAYNRSDSLAFLAKSEEPSSVVGNCFHLLSVDRNCIPAPIRIY